MAQWFAHIQGQQYGPASESDLRAWISQGRVKPTDNVWCEGMANWIPAAQAFPDVQAAAATPAATGAVTYAPTGMLPPHRGTAVLVLGILSLVFRCTCIVGLILGIIAWVMGNRDLAAMAAGQMDPAGRGNTNAGRICGMIGTIVACVEAVFWIIYIIAIAGAVATGHGHMMYR